MYCEQYHDRKRVLPVNIGHTLTKTNNIKPKHENQSLSANCMCIVEQDFTITLFLPRNAFCNSYNQFNEFISK